MNCFHNTWLGRGYRSETERVTCCSLGPSCLTQEIFFFNVLSEKHQHRFCMETYSFQLFDLSALYLPSSYFLSAQCCTRDKSPVVFEYLMFKLSFMLILMLYETEDKKGGPLRLLPSAFISLSLSHLHL